MGDVILDAGAARRWLGTLAGQLHERAGELTRLDAAIGDADHGTNMDRGFQAVRQRVLDAGEAQDVPTILRQTGMALIGTVGGAGGPLYGTFFLRMGQAAAADGVTLDGLCDALAAGVEGVVQRGRAARGDKTMVDALGPAVDALREAVAAGRPPAEALRAAAAAAEAGARATIPLQARKGRASYLGERSIGHQDPGATSSALLVRCLADSIGDA